VASTFVTRLDGPSPEREIAVDLVRRALPATPVLLLVAGLLRGLDGAWSAGYGLAIVLVNFLLAAALMAWAARISLALLMGVALLGYLVRLGLIFLAVLLVKDAGWVDLMTLGLTIIVAHLGLLFWETRFVSASLAFPALRPGAAGGRQ
jgi:hypothetical protein